MVFKTFEGGFLARTLTISYAYNIHNLPLSVIAYRGTFL